LLLPHEPYQDPVLSDHHPILGDYGLLRRDQCPLEISRALALDFSGNALSGSCLTPSDGCSALSRDIIVTIYLNANPSLVSLVPKRLYSKPAM
jgi:hypothetical protein